jgi:hypothetical protein
MKFSVLFTPLQTLDPKRRKNAKPTTVAKIVYVHEDMSMKDMMVKVFNNIKRCDFFLTSWLYAGYHDGLEGSDSLSFTYTVYRSQNKDISLDNEDDYLELCTQVQDARKAEVTLKLVEHKVYLFIVSLSVIQLTGFLQSLRLSLVTIQLKMSEMRIAMKRMRTPGRNKNRYLFGHFMHVLIIDCDSMCRRQRK